MTERESLTTALYEMARHGLLAAGAIENITKLAWDGLHTDGAHHKQWYLEQIAAALGLLDGQGPPDWTPGIIP